MLVDTSVWIDYLNGYHSPQADWLARAIAIDAPIVLCGVVLTEILLGLPETEANQIEILLQAFPLTCEPERQDYCAAAQLYRTCRSQGLTIRSVIDCLIAQICLKHEYSLLAKDRDFVHIARYFPLQLCDYA
ncbi:MAG: PIN domain nuclease [Acaryochloridaceae cyanobacterium CSU_5_19]|nr:PIN domain nuclease [Acaryochloridaceae cyanobacterium CSU_5_19]